MAIQTRKSNKNRPARIMIYGPEGVGKSTFGAKSDKPVFISPEGGTDQLTDSEGNPVEEMTGVRDWDSMRAKVKELIKDNHEFKTLVIDSADWIENLCHKKIVGTSGKSIITVNGGYGAGFRASQNLHAELIEDLSILREKKSMNIIVTAHAHVKGVKDPEMIDDYDAFEIKCHEYVSALWREWVDGLFFVRFKTFIHQGEDETARARALSDGSRVVYTVKRPAFQAKNRYSMPAELEFKENFWTVFSNYKVNGPITESCAEITQKLKPLVEKVLDEEKKKAIEASMETYKTNATVLTQIRGRVDAILAEQNKE